MAMLTAYLALVGGASALIPASGARSAVQPRRATSVTCVASGDADKALLSASRKVTLVAKKFGITQGKAAQAWVEEAIKSGSAPSSGLMEMQLKLFEECSVDDETGRCKDLSEAIDALTAAAEQRRTSPPTEEDSFSIISGATPIQEAATKLRATASLFGPAQKAAANAWIKKVTSGAVTSGDGLLEEQITLFGECVLSEDGSPTNCQKLEEALTELQAAIESCDISTPEAEEECNPTEVAAEIAADAESEAKVEAAVAEVEAAVAEVVETASKATAVVADSVKVTGRKRKAIKSFFGKIFGGGGAAAAPVLSVEQACVFLADPSAASVPFAEKKAFLEAKGVDPFVIAQAACTAAAPAPVLSVEQACVFLADPSAASVPFAEKKAFLEAKGVDPFVIAEAACTAPDTTLVL